MSGHSKWHNIQKTKGAQDAKRAAAFTKIAKEMYVAVKEGGGSTDPSYNSRLATVITKAKAANMPNDNIKRVLEKAANAGSGDSYESITYEGYGPCGTFLLNADGLQMRGCTAEKLVLTQRSRRAKRPAIVEGCWFRDGIEVVRTGEAAVAPGTPLILRDNLTGPGGPQQAEGTE